ncbi:MAG: hypothetical protein ABIQ90_16375 [Polaromonas sp.]
MRPWLILINDFSHDLFTGLWFGSFVTLIVLRGKVGDPVLLSNLLHVFTILCLASLIVIMLTGIFRFFYYRNWDSAEMAAIKKRLLKIKHALLGSLMLIGTGMVIFWAL